MDIALDLGADFVATGHYCRKEEEIIHISLKVPQVQAPKRPFDDGKNTLPRPLTGVPGKGVHQINEKLFTVNSCHNDIHEQSLGHNAPYRKKSRHRVTSVHSVNTAEILRKRDWPNSANRVSVKYRKHPTSRDVLISFKMAHYGYTTLTPLIVTIMIWALG